MLQLRGLRQLGSLYAVAFLVASAGAPHRHLNGLEDLVSDGPSDSGVIVERLGHSNDCESGIHAVRLIDDDPCLSCFHNDVYVSEAAPIFVLRENITALESLHAFGFPRSLEPAADRSSSRSPPLAA